MAKLITLEELNDQFPNTGLVELFEKDYTIALTQEQANRICEIERDGPTRHRRTPRKVADDS